jgi:hypothetical protein
LIEDLLQSWSRIAEKCGFKLVESPVEQAQAFSNDNPLQSVIPIRLSLPPPSLTELQEEFPQQDFPPQYFEVELLKRFGFVPDMEADSLFPDNSVTFSFSKSPCRYTQMVHRSGTAFVQICEPGGGFLWVNNRLHLASTAGRGSSASVATTNTTPMPPMPSAISVNTTSAQQSSVAPNAANAAGHSMSNAVNPDTIRITFTKFCEDAFSLDKFWKELLGSKPVDGSNGDLSLEPKV